MVSMSGETWNHEIMAQFLGMNYTWRFSGGKIVLKILFLYLHQLRYQGMEYTFCMEFEAKIIFQNAPKIIVEKLRIVVIIKRIFEHLFLLTLKTKFHSCCCSLLLFPDIYFMEITLSHNVCLNRYNYVGKY